jgi:hypothetical protein
MLTACGSLASQAPLSTSVLPQKDPGQIGNSLTTPVGYKSGDLLYVSGMKANDVYVYARLAGKPKLVQTLTGFSQPAGECVDTVGNVWITSLAAGFGEVIEYAHGGSKPITTLNNPQERSLDCSVDRITGNLAVTNFSDDLGGQGSLSIYTSASGAPTKYVSSTMYRMYFCGYDNGGNLFIDGEDMSGNFQFAELLKGSSAFTNITVNQGFAIPGGVQWHGKYVAVGDWAYQGSKIYHVKVSGSTGTVIGATPLYVGANIGAFRIQKLGKVEEVIAVAQGSGTSVPGDVEFYKYPKGGSPVKTISNLSEPFGAAVSTLAGN